MSSSPDSDTGGPVRISDPARIRALAHPVRLDLLSLLSDAGELTATQCAERLGETVANCSFHLRTLARAGFIEPAPARGREKPWRTVGGGQDVRPEPGDTASQQAVTELAGLAMLREVERVRAFLGAHPVQDDGWEDTVRVSTQGFWATADELRQLIDDLDGLTARFADRQHDPARRPAGAVHGRLFATVNPDSFPPAPAAEPAPQQEDAP